MSQRQKPARTEILASTYAWYWHRIGRKQVTVYFRVRDQRFCKSRYVHVSQNHFRSEVEEGEAGYLYRVQEGRKWRLELRER